MAEWTAELTVDEELARRLIGEQFPELAARKARLLAEGWDNTVWLVDETWVFRFPRRKIAVPLVERELAVLPHLESALPLAIPAPVFSGHPTDAYPWPFLGSRFLPGSELGSTELTEDAELKLAATLGHFLRVLHSPEIAGSVSGLSSLPVDPNSRADMVQRVPRTRDTIAQVQKLGLWCAPATVERVLESAAQLPQPRPSALIHGDLHFRHLLVGDGELTGVIDWGDLCLADPSVDLQLHWSYFSAEGRDAFLRAYGPVADERLLRGRVFALFICAVLALYGHDESRPQIQRAALVGLERTAEG